MPPRAPARTPGRRSTRGTQGSQDGEEPRQHEPGTAMEETPTAGASRSQGTAVTTEATLPSSSTTTATAPTAFLSAPSPTLQASTTAKPPMPKPTSGLLKVKPKIVRRSAEDRQRNEQQEDERARLKSKDIAVSSPSRGNFQSRTSRPARDQKQTGEGTTPALQSRKPTSAASGPFGRGSFIAPRTNSRRGGSTAARSQPTSSRSASTAVKRESALGPKESRQNNTAKKPSIKTEESNEAFYISSGDDELAGPRINVNNINSIDQPLVIEDENNEDEEPITSRKRSIIPRESVPTWGLKPVTMDRKEHTDRSNGIRPTSTDPELLRQRAKERETPGLFVEGKSEDILMAKAPRKKKAQDIEFLAKPRKWAGAYTDSEDEQTIESKPKSKSKPRLKKEPLDVNSDLQVGNQNPDAIDLEDSAMETTNTNTTKTKSSKRRTRVIPITTEEELQERSRQIEDIDMIARELRLNGLSKSTHFSDPSDPETVLPQTTPSLSNPEPSASSAPAIDSSEEKEGRLYVFQFPSLLPDLYNPLETAPSPPTSNLNTTQSSGEREAPATSKPPPAKKNTSRNSSTIKPEPSPSSSTLPTSQAQSTSAPVSASVPPTTSAPSTNPTKNPPGFAGYLSIHRSRRIRLCWGGFDFDVARGADVSFAENAVVVSSSQPIDSVSTSSTSAPSSDHFSPNTAFNTTVAGATSKNSNESQDGKEGLKAEEVEEHDRIDLLSSTLNVQNGNRTTTNTTPSIAEDRVTSMGAIRGKMVVVPDWSRALEPSTS